MIKRKVFIVIVLIATTISFNSCYKDRLGLDKMANSELNHDIAAPAVNSKLTMQMVVDESQDNWIEDSDGFLTLVYSDTVESDEAQSVFDIGSYDSDTNFLYPLPPTVLPGDSTSEFFVYSPEINPTNNDRIDSVLFKKGWLDISITTNLNHDARIEIIVPELRKYGVTFFKSMTLDYNGGSSNTYTASFPLNLYTLSLDTTLSGARKFDEYFKVIVKMSNNSNNSPYNIDINQTIRDATFYNIWGYFGQRSYGVSYGAMELSLFNNRAGGSVTIEQAELTMEVINENGVDFDLNFEKLYAEDKDGNQTNFTSPLMPNFEVYGVDYDSLYESKSTTYVFDENNSNLVDLVNINPERIKFRSKIKSNPPWSTSNKNFLLDTGRVKVRSKIEIPLFGKALDVQIRDTVNFSIDNVDELESLELRINAYNAFPVESAVQLYFADSTATIIDSVFADMEMIVQSGVVGPAPDYKITEPTHKLTVVDLPSEKLENLFAMEKVIIQARISTYNSGNDLIKIYSDNYVDLKVAFRANTKINL